MKDVQEELISRLRNSEDVGEWEKLRLAGIIATLERHGLAALLHAAGYSIVKHPELLERGRPGARPA